MTLASVHLQRPPAGFPGHWLAAAALATAGLLAACSRAAAPSWQGYLTAEFVRVASPLGGTLERLEVTRGETVAPGAPLFTLERTADEAALRAAREREQQARSRLENLQKGLRPTEIASIEARIDQARASAGLAARELERLERLFRDGAAARSDLDRAVAAHELERKRVEQGRAELATARLGAREDEIRAAEAEVAGAEAEVVRAQWNVDQKQKAAPTAALVHDTLYRPGEWVAPGSPVVSLLPPANLKVRFFVPEAEVSRLKLGDPLRVRIDGVSASPPVRVTYIAPQVEYTPPVIYSQENRARLVFMVEAAFEVVDPRVLHPGQPVEVLP